MNVSKENENNKDLLAFARYTKAKLKSVKVSFGLNVKFSIEREGETQYMEHYFQENEPHVFIRHDKELI